MNQVPVPAARATKNLPAAGGSSYPVAKSPDESAEVWSPEVPEELSGKHFYEYITMPGPSDPYALHENMEFHYEFVHNERTAVVYTRGMNPSVPQWQRRVYTADLVQLSFDTSAQPKRMKQKCLRRYSGRVMSPNFELAHASDLANGPERVCIYDLLSSGSELRVRCSNWGDTVAPPDFDSYAYRLSIR